MTNTENIIEYYKTHTAKETASLFNIAEWKVVELSRKSGHEKRPKMPEKLNDLERQVIIGSLLGDGSFSYVKDGFVNPPKAAQANSRFGEGHGIEQHDWLCWKYEKIKRFCSCKPHKSFRPNRIQLASGKVVDGDGKLEGSSFRSRFHPEFTAMEKEWYVRDDNGKYILNHLGQRIKKLPKVLDVSPLSISIWFLDDGCARCKVYSSGLTRSIDIYSMSFTLDENHRLVEILNNFGIKDCCVYYKNGKPMIRINAKSFVSFVDFVKNTLKDYDIPDCMKYKYIIENYREPYGPHCGWVSKTNTSGVTNVYFHQNRWIARAPKSRDVLGYFGTKNEAIACLDDYYRNSNT